MNPEVVLVARAVLAGVLLAAAVAKAFDREGSRQAAADLGVPARFAPAAGIALPVVETAAAALLLVPATAVVGALLAITLLALFTTVLVVNLAKGNRPDCHCFGQASAEPIGPWSVARNVALLALGGLALAEAGSSVGAALPVLGAAVVAQGMLLLPLLKAQAGTGRRSTAPTPSGLAIGALAPDFELPDLDGHRHTLADLRADGRAVLLTFVDAHCGPCAAIGPEIADWRRSFADRLNVVVIGAGDPDELRAKAEDAGFDFVLTQPATAVADAYRYLGTPGAVVVDAEGRIASAVAAGAPDIRRLVADTTSALPQVWVPTATPGVAPTPVRAIGDPAPYVELDALNGTKVSLGLMAGRLALVVFWDPSCGYCAAMLEDWKAWEATRPDTLGVLVLADGPPDAVAALAMTSIVGLDAGGLTRRAFGAEGTPMAVLIDANGRIASPIAVGRDEVLALATRAGKLATLAERQPAPSAS